MSEHVDKYKVTKFELLVSILFFKEDPKVQVELDEQVWQRTKIYMYTTGILVAVWGIFDFFIDYENLWVFLALRAAYTPLTLLCAYYFHLAFFKKRHRWWAMAHYLLLIVDIGIMCLWTDAFVKYLIGFSTIFWGASVIMLWRFWHTVLPGLVVILIAYVRFAFFPHNVPVGEFITGVYYFMTCLTFTSIISAYGYWTAYQLAQSNMVLKSTQDKLIQAEKMASMNMVVASVAHEINTPIGTAITAASHAEEEFERILSNLEVGEVTLDQLANPANDGIVSIRSTLKELGRTAKLVEKFKEAAVDQSNVTDSPVEFDLPTYVQENVIDAAFAPRLRQSKISVSLEGERSLLVESYPGEIGQVFTNLIMNSLVHGFSEDDHQTHGGNISIRIEKSGDNSVAATYKDTGKGMSKEVLGKIYDPFYTTRGTHLSKLGRGQQGSGLGMSIVYNIVTKTLGGTLDVSSEIGKGVTFTMLLPRVSPSLAFDT